MEFDQTALVSRPRRTAPCFEGGSTFPSRPLGRAGLLTEAGGGSEPLAYNEG